MASAQLRILHILDHSLPLHSGYAFRSAAIIREQRALGWETCQVTSAKHVVAVAEEAADGMVYHRTQPTAELIGRLPVVNQLDVIASLRRRTAQLLQEFRPHLIHAHSPCLTGLAAFGPAGRANVPVVYEMRASWEDAAVSHGTTTPGSLRYRLSRQLETYVLRKADAVTTICAGLRADILERGIPSGKVTIVPNAVDAGMLLADEPGARRVRGQFADRGGQRLIGFIGSFYAYEGLDVLIRAASKLRATHPEYRFVIAGGGPEDSRLRGLVEREHLGDIVRFTGRVPHADVRAYYGAMDLLVYPRRASPLTEKVTPLKPLESMAQGRPVLASDVAGHRELIEHGVTGLLFPADDPDALSAAIPAALADERLGAIRDGGLRFVREQRTWVASVARYEAVYRKILEGSRPHPDASPDPYDAVP